MKSVQESSGHWKFEPESPINEQRPLCVCLEKGRHTTASQSLSCLWKRGSNKRLKLPLRANFVNVCLIQLWQFISWISGNSRITDASFKLVGRQCPDLQHLYMTDCQRITDYTLKSLVTCRNLTVINLADCVRYCLTIPLK